MRPLKSVFRKIFIKSGICILIFSSLVSAQNAQAASGITYTGRIFKGDVPIDTGTVVFDIWIKTDTGCALYHEQRSLSMVGSGGTYSFDIGDGSVVGDYYFGVPNTIVDVFDNKRTYSFTSGCAGSYTALVPTEGRKMNVQFTPPGDSAQVLPELVINPVPFALFANKANQVVGTVAIANGGTGATTKAAGFNALSPIAAKGDIISSNGTDNINLAVGTDTYVLTADSSQASGLKWAVPPSAPVSSVAAKTGAVTLDWGDIANGAGKYLTYKPNNTACNTNETLKFDGTNWVCVAMSAAGITGLTGDVTATGPGSAAATIGVGKVTSSHILDGTILGADMNFTGVNNATSNLVIQDSTGKFFNFACSTTGHIATWTVTGWTCQAPATATVSAQSSLANTKIWIGDGAGKAQEFSLSGDATMTAGGVVTVDKTQAAVASKILQLTASSVAVTKGADIGGAGAGVAHILYPNTATNTTLTLPNSAGSANQVLQTDGAGVLTWATPLSSSTGFVNGGNSFAGNSSIGNNDNFNLDIKTNAISRMTILNSGNVGIGTTTPTAPLNVNTTSTSNNSSDVGTLAQLWVLPSSAPASPIYPSAISGETGVGGGASANVSITGTSGMSYHNGVGTLGIAVGLNGSVYNKSIGTITSARSANLYVNNISSGTIANAWGADVSILNTSTGTIGTAYGVHIATPQNSGGGTIGTAYGLYVDTQTAATTNYAIYSAGGNNYFGGNVGIGISNPFVPLDIGGPNAAITAIGAGGAQLVVETTDGTTAVDQGGSIGLAGYDGAVYGRYYAKILGAKENSTSGNYSGYLAFATRTNGSSPAERMRISSVGNVGIGTTSPGSALDVKGTLRLSGATSGYVGFAPAAAAGAATYTLPTTQGSAGQVLSTDGVATTPTLSWITPSGGSVTSVSGTAPISVATGTTTPVISITAGTTAGQALRWNGSAWASGFIAMTDLRSTVTGANMFAASCLANQTLTYNSVGDVMSCASIAIAATQITSGVLPVANGGTGTATGSITGTGALTFAAGGASNDITITPAGTGKTAITNLQLPSSGVIVSGTTGCPGVGAITRDDNGDFYICK